MAFWPRPVWLLLVLAGSAGAGEITAADLARLPGADVVILGEVHDNPGHHRNQALAVAALAPRALVFEMLTEAQAGRMPADRGTAATVAAAIGWEDAGWPDFALYHPILRAAPAAAVFGGDLPPGETARAVREGAAAVFGPQAAAYGLAEPLDPAEQAAREAAMQADHCNALPADLLPGMVEAQRLHDAALARAVAAAYRATGGPVVLITGNGHARRDEGVPAVLARVLPKASVLSLGQIEGGQIGPGQIENGQTEGSQTEGGQTGPGRIGGAADAAPPFDLWIVTEGAARPDPCEGFGRRSTG